MSAGSFGSFVCMKLHTWRIILFEARNLKKRKLLSKVWGKELGVYCSWKNKILKFQKFMKAIEKYDCLLSFSKMQQLFLFLCFRVRVAYSSPWKIWNISQPCEISWNISLKFQIFPIFLSYQDILFDMPFKQLKNIEWKWCNCLTVCSIFSSS